MAYRKKLIGLMKDELGETIITKCVAVRPKTCSYLMGDGQNDKKAKGTRKSVMKRILKFNNNKNWLSNNEIIPKSHQRFKGEAHNVYTEEIKKSTLSSNDDKGLQTLDRITSYHMVQALEKYTRQSC